MIIFHCLHLVGCVYLSPAEYTIYTKSHRKNNTLEFKGDWRIDVRTRKASGITCRLPHYTPEGIIMQQTAQRVCRTEMY